MGMKNNINPLAAIATPDTRKPGLYDCSASNSQPEINTISLDI
jgi:hypothetical protein